MSEGAYIHRRHVGHIFDTFDVACTLCDFEVTGLSSIEAAEDTIEWHMGRPSYLANGGDTPEDPNVHATSSP